MQGKPKIVGDNQGVYRLKGRRSLGSSHIRTSALEVRGTTVHVHPAIMTETSQISDFTKRAFASHFTKAPCTSYVKIKKASFEKTLVS